MARIFFRLQPGRSPGTSPITKNRENVRLPRRAPKVPATYEAAVADASALLAVEECVDASHQFFAFLHDKLLGTRPILRVREKGFAEPWLDAPLAKLLGKLGRDIHQHQHFSAGTLLY